KFLCLGRAGGSAGFVPCGFPEKHNVWDEFLGTISSGRARNPKRPIVMSPLMNCHGCFQQLKENAYRAKNYYKDMVTGKKINLSWIAFGLSLACLPNNLRRIIDFPILAFRPVTWTSCTELSLQTSGRSRFYQEAGPMGGVQSSNAGRDSLTRAYSKPSLSAQPSPVVTEGGRVTLQCASGQQHDRFILIKEGPQRLSWKQDSQYNYHTQQYQAQFPVGPVTSSQRWTFTCYSFDNNSPQVWSESSDPLELVFSGDQGGLGMSKKPSLLTHQGHILDPEKSLTLQCCSDINYDRFLLYKVGEDNLTQHWNQQTQAGFSLANFTLASMSSATAGQYRCYGAHNLSSEWSVSSDPLEIFVTGRGQIPVNLSLSVKPKSTVHAGDKVTLLCQSPYKVDTFILSKEGAADQLQRLKSKFEVWEFQAEFSMTAMTSALSGTYRCYGSWNSSLYLLSHASAPVELTVSVSETQHHRVENLLRMGFAVMILIVLGILLFEAWGSQRQAHHAAEK
ncbi:leukocyte immunoglobulin-like receptor subfamily B member 3 isoform X2, partial [Sigmodon hispidus]